LTRNFHLREIIIIKPEIRLVGFPDTLNLKKGRFTNIYEDAYPLASKIFTEVKVDSIIVQRGKVLAAHEAGHGQFSIGQYEFSAVLRNFAINRFSYYNKDRVFYSRDIDFKVLDVKYSLADSLYFLSAAEIGFSLARSGLYGTNVSLRPNFHSRRLRHARQGDFFQVDIPAFSIDGINLYSALTEKEVSLSKVRLNHARLKIFHNNSEEATAAKKDNLSKRTKRQFSKADLYTVISGKLKSVNLDSLIIRGASLEYFRTLAENNPELRVSGMDIDISSFSLDSLAHTRKDRIFYAGDFDLRLHEVNLALRDHVHILNAGIIHVSTKKKLVEMENAMLFPNEKKNLENPDNRKNTFYIFIPGLYFRNIDLLKAFHRQELIFTRLNIETPDVKYTKYHTSENREARFRKPGDFFRESNEDVVYNLLKKYVSSVKGDSISVDHGFISYYQHNDSLQQKISSGSFDLSMYEFLIDSVHGMNHQGYFYSRDFTFNMKSFTYTSPDSLRHLEVGNIHISTTDSVIGADSISFLRTNTPASSLQGFKSDVSVRFSAEHLHLQGLNHKKLFLEKILKAKTLLLLNPHLSIKAGKPVKVSGSQDDERIASSQGVVKFLDVEKLIILKGDISFDGLERTKSSYFKLRDIDFTIKGLAMKLPDKGKLNGSMQFDSVDLSVRPLRMIVMDSTYEVSCDNISLNSYPLNIHARGIRILPLEPSSGQSREKIRITATIPDMEISNFYFDRALFSGEWIIGGIRFSNLLAGIEMVRKNKPDGRGNQFPLALKFNPSLGTFRIDSICLENANIDIRINKGEKVSAYRLNDLRASFYRIAIDSLHQEGKPGTPLFNAGDISLSARGMNFLSDDSLYTFGFKRFRLSTGRKSLALDSLFYFPNYTDAEFYKKTGFQDDRYKISVPSLEFQNLDFGMLITDKAIRSGSLVVSGPRIETLRDKRVAGLRPGKRYLPQSQIKKIPIHVTIDSIFQKNGFAEYEEQTGDTPGRIFFDRMNSVVVNFSNEPGAWKQNPLITMEGTCRFMGKGKLGGQYFFDMLNPRDSLWWTGTVDSVDLRDINPMLSSLLPAKVIHGFVDNARFFVSANDNTATGSALVKYREFYFEFDPLQKGFMKKWKNELITDVANTLVPDDNPEYKHKLRAGIVFFERDTTRGFFNYVWKSTLSGLKSTAGFNSRDQLQIKLKRPGKAK
jgi:hypothetical protein